MYLDNAATSFPKPDCVCDAVDAWMRGGAGSLGRGNHRGTDSAAQMVERCRMRLARLLGVSSPSQVVFTLNCTDSLNTVFRGFLNSGDRVIASTLDHNSVLRPLEAMQESSGISYRLIDFDPAKDRLNRARHGLSLAFARKLIWEEALVWVDSRYEYDEIRMIGLVPEGNTLYYVAFVDRGEIRRVISLRYAERTEIKHYAKNYP